MINDALGSLFAGCSPETAFIAGVIFSLMSAFEWLIVAKLLDAIFDGIKFAFRKVWILCKHRKSNKPI